MGRAFSMILRPPVEIAVINGLAASREKSARHSWASASDQVTDRVSAVTCTRTGPDFTPDVSTGIAASAAKGPARRRMAAGILISIQPIQVDDHNVGGLAERRVSDCGRMAKWGDILRGGPIKPPILEGAHHAR